MKIWFEHRRKLADIQRDKAIDEIIEYPHIPRVGEYVDIDYAVYRVVEVHHIVRGSDEDSSDFQLYVSVVP